MELRHLRHFVAVAEELHFARAAERLGMEQSPLSHSIRNLESELGVALFHRTTRRTWLTQAGMRFHAEALRVLEAADLAKAAARNDDPERLGSVTIGLAEHAAGEPFTRFLFELEHRTPPVTVELREVTPAEAVRQVEERILDVAIVLDVSKGAGLRRSLAWAEALTLIAPLGHPYAERERVSLAELTDQRLVMPYSAASPGYTAQVEALLARHGVRPASPVAVKHQNTMVSLASAGRGLALLPESIAHGLTTVAVVPIAEPDAAITSWLVYRDEEPSDAVSSALDIAALVGEDGPSVSDRVV